MSLSLSWPGEEHRKPHTLHHGVGRNNRRELIDQGAVFPEQYSSLLIVYLVNFALFQ